MDRKVYDQGAQSRDAHAQYDFEQIYPLRMISGLPTEVKTPRRGVIMDIGTGVGRDAVAMHERANGRMLVVGIDPDEANYRKAVETYPDKEIVLCRHWDDVAKVKRESQIAYLVREVQGLEAPPSKLRADFINCSAVLMFPPAEEHQAFLNSLHGLAKPYRNVFMRYRTEMLKEGMTQINDRTFFNQSRMAGFAIERLADFPDPPPSSRDFKWHDYFLTALPKP